MQYEVYIKSSINFTHSTMGSKKEFLKPHAHVWEVEVYITTDNLKDGISIDFVYAKESLDKILSKINGHYLNSLTVFKNKNPTAENIGIFIYRELNKELKKGKITKIRIGDEFQKASIIFDNT